jgi:hypothetical protein
MSDERNDAGQFTSGEQLTGEAGLEHDAGYKPMPSAEKEEQPEYATAREAFDSLPEEAQPEPTPIVYHNLETGELADQKETVKLERAAQDLASYESQVVDNRASSISSEFADMVDQMRADAIKDNPKLAEELGIEPPAPKPVEQKAEQIAQKSEQPDPFDSVEGLEEETREALKKPQVRQFLEQNAAETEQAVQSLKAAVSNSHTFGQAAVITVVPEFAQYPFEQWPALASALKQAGDPRGMQVENLLSNVAALNQRQQVLEYHQQHQQQQNFETQVKAEDARLIEMVGGEKAANEANAAMITYLTENGVPRNQQLNVIMQNPVLRTAEARQTVWKAARYDALMNAPKAIASRQVPPVQRPGTYVPRATGPAADIKALQRQLDSTASESQQLKIARQILQLQHAS